MTAEKDGFCAGDSIRFSVWNKGLNKEVSARAEAAVDLIYSPDQLYVLSDFVAACETAVDGQSLMPTQFALKQNYPNPFNPVTTIEYELPEVVHVQLMIYTLNGRLVETLVDKTQQAGCYVVSWNSANHSSGVYFCRMVAGRYSALIKMVVIK